MNTVLRNTWAVLVAKEKRHFRILVLLDIIISVVDILSLILLLKIIQFYIQPTRTAQLSFLPDWIGHHNSVAFIAIFFALFGLKNMAAYFVARAHYSFVGKVAVRISANSLVNYQEGGYEEFVNVDSSAHIRRIGFQPFEFSQYMLSGLQQLITQSFIIVLTVVAILVFNAKLFLLLLIILLPPVIVVFYIIKKRMTIAKKNIRSSNERSYQYLLDALKGYVEANVYARNDFFLNRFIAARKVFSADLFETISLQNLPSRFIEVFAVLGLFALIAIAKWTGNDDTGALITIGAFMAAAYKIIPGIVKIINTGGQMRAYEFAVADMMAKPLPGIPPIERSPQPITTIRLHNVCFQYADQPVLNNFSCLLKKGDFAGLTGASGRGKTTILNLILGFLTPLSGEILINENGVHTMSPKSFWPSIAYSRQQPFLIHDTILRNITLQEGDHDESRLREAITVSGLADFISKFPEGIHKVITENGKNISGGQQQRIVIARALYKNADTILLDEPFNELDETSTISLLEHFRYLATMGKIILMITHDKKSLSYCNKIISMDA